MDALRAAVLLRPWQNQMKHVFMLPTPQRLIQGFSTIGRKGNHAPDLTTSILMKRLELIKHRRVDTSSDVLCYHILSAPEDANGAGGGLRVPQGGLGGAQRNRWKPCKQMGTISNLWRQVQS